MVAGPKKYEEVHIFSLPRALEPALSQWLFKNGCAGTAQNLDFVQEDLRYSPLIKDKMLVNVIAYFERGSRDDIEPRLLNWFQKFSPTVTANWKNQKEKDWLSQWKKHFKTFSAAEFLISPPWEKHKPSLKRIVIEPGMAFGTGTHATTQFALELLRMLSDAKEIQNKTVLDVGAGSGILSVASEKLGAKSVLSIDNDPESWRECKKTFKLNRTKKCKVTELQLNSKTLPRDIVIANIIDGVLMELKNKLWKATKPGGFLVLSGLLADGASAFEKDFLEKKRGQVLYRLTDHEWSALVIAKAKK